MMKDLFLSLRLFALATLLMTGISSAQAWTAQVTVDGVKYDVYISGEKYAAVADSALVALNNDKNLSGVVNIASSVTYEYQWVDEDSNGDPIIVTCHLTATVTGIKNGYTTYNNTHGAFISCSKITQVNLPNTINYIGNYAFERCTGLTSVNIPNSVTSIGNNAFSFCTGLANVNIPNSVITIGNDAFSISFNLKSIIIGSSVNYIGNAAFYGDENLTDVTCLAITPPLTSPYDPFDNYNASLHVPRISINAYKNMWPWSEFTNIDGFDLPDAPGDVDGDGKVNIDDVTSLINGLLGDDALSNGADMDGDGRVNINDVTALINYLLYGHL